MCVFAFFKSFLFFELASAACACLLDVTFANGDRLSSFIAFSRSSTKRAAAAAISFAALLFPSFSGVPREFFRVLILEARFGTDTGPNPEARYVYGGELRFKGFNKNTSVCVRSRSCLAAPPPPPSTISSSNVVVLLRDYRGS